MSRLLVAQRALTVPGWAKDALWRNARAVPSLDLRFADNKSLVDAVTGASLVTFTRASSGTFVDSDGVLRTAVTNLLVRSEEFGTTWTPSNITISPDAIAAPNGTLTADKSIATTTNGAHQLYQINSGTSGVTYTISFYVKEGEYNRFRFGPGNAAVGGGDKVVEINLALSNPIVSQDAIFNSSAFVLSVGNGWYRVGATFTATATGTMTVAVLQTLINNAGSSSFAGDGTSGIYIWGAQLEQSATVGEYIPTTSAINSAPRFDHNPTTGESLGLLVEEQRTNLLLRSEEFDNASWIKSALLAFGSGSTANAIAGPSGAVSADLLTEDTATTEHFAEQNFNTISGTTYAFSVFVKAGANKTTVVLRLTTAAWSGGANNQVRFNLSTGASTIIVGSPVAFSQNFGNGWWRFTIVSTASSTGTPAARIHLTDSSGNTSYTGDGTSGIYLWGADLQAGAFPTSYIPTTTAAATRIADVASITGTAFSGWYNASEGTIYHQGRTPTAANFFSIDDGTANNRITSYMTSATAPLLFVSTGGVVQVNLSGSAITAGSLFAQADAYKAADFAIAVNGGTVSTSSSGSVPVVNKMIIGANVSGGALVNGTIRRLTYWPTRLPNSTLQTLTQ